MTIEVVSETAMKALGKKLGTLLKGGEIIELIGDVGAGKTTLVKGVARGLAIDEDIQSPSFTISRIYNARDELTLAHYDFYRLHDAGIMADELHETLHDPKTITIVEWADIVSGVLPKSRIAIHITSPSEESRLLEMDAHTEAGKMLLKELA